MANGQVAEAMSAHEGHAVLDLLVSADSHGIVGHYLGHACAAGIAGFGHDAAHEIAFRKNSDYLAVVSDGYSPDIPLDHGAHRFQNGVTEIGLVGLLIFNEIADPHLIPPVAR